MDTRTKSLVRRAKKADKDAARELLTIHYASIFAYLRRLCRTTQDAEDLTQEAFLKVWASLGSFTGRSTFSTWLHKIAYNTYIDFRRRNARSSEAFADPWWQQRARENPGPSVNASERQLARRLYEAIDQLDENRKQAVHLHYYQGLSLRQTAKVLGISSSTVKYRLREVFRILRAKMPEEEAQNRTRTIPIAKGELI